MEQKNRSTDLSNTNEDADGSENNPSNTNKTGNDGASGKAEQEKTAGRTLNKHGNDEEDAADLESLKGVVEREDSKKKAKES